MNSGTSATAKKAAKPVARRGVYMDFAAGGKKPAVMNGGVSAAQQRPEQPVRLRPDARAAQANARIAQKRAQVEAQQRAMRLAKAGVPGRAPGLTNPAQAVARPQVKPATEPRPKRPLARGRVVKPRGPLVGATVADAQAAVTAAQRQGQIGGQVRPQVQRTGVTVAQVTETPAGRLIEQKSYEEIDFGVVEDYKSDKPVAEAAPEVAKVPEPGSNWPFLRSVTVEKRPLSGGKKVATKSQPAPAPTTVTPAASSIALNSGVAKKGSKLPMVGLILLTIILGVAVGAAVYFAIFQGGGPE